LPLANFLTTHQRKSKKNELFFDFAARKFGIIKYCSYLCIIFSNAYMMNEKRNIMMQAIRDTSKTVVPEGSVVILFGSQARGDARNDSDWDVLILLDKDRITSQDIDDYTYPLRELGWGYNENINTILYTKKDWEKNAGSPFVENVNEDGITLWE